PGSYSSAGRMSNQQYGNQCCKDSEGVEMFHKNYGLSATLVESVAANIPLWRGYRIVPQKRDACGGTYDTLAAYAFRAVCLLHWLYRGLDCEYRRRSPYQCGPGSFTSRRTRCAESSRACERHRHRRRADVEWEVLCAGRDERRVRWQPFRLPT